MSWQAWTGLVLLALSAAYAAGRSVFRRYQDFRIREHRRRVAWGEYKASRRK